MTYVGAVPTTGDFKVLDSITTSSATTFNLRQGGVAVYPQSANPCLVVLNGILQTAGSSFNIVNDTIVFASSLASSDVINQILVLGNVNDIGVPSDNTVSTAKIQADAINSSLIADDSISDEHLDITAITGQTEKTSLADADKFLISDSAASGALKYVQNSNLGGGGRAVLLSTTTLSSTGTVTFDNSLITSTYNNYLFTLEDVHCGSGNVQIHFEASVDNGSSYYNSAGNYRKISFNGIENESNNSFTSRYGTNEEDMRVTGNYANNGNDAALKVDAQVYCMSLNGSAYKKFMVHSAFGDASDPPKLVYENAVHLFDGSQSAVNNIRIFPSNGDFSSGKVKLFGLK